MLSPTALFPGEDSDFVFFVRYGPDSRLSVHSNGGRIDLFDPRRDGVFLGPNAILGSDISAFAAYPASLDLASFSSDIFLNGQQITAIPSERGSMEIFAARDIKAFAIVGMSDADTSILATPASPSEALDGLSPIVNFILPAARHIDDPFSNLIYAGRDISGLRLNMPKATTVSAGRDIVDLVFNGQNARAGDTTSIYAGRDITYTPAGVTGHINLGGPGYLDILAGRDIDFGFSQGVTTTGRLLDLSLPVGSGADVIALAGLGSPLGVTPGGAHDFVSDIVGASTSDQQRLISYVQQRTGQSGLDFAAAAAAFRELPRTEQLPLLIEVFFAQLVKSGEEANSDPKIGFTRGFAAIDALFPGSRPAQDQPPNPYAGDLKLSFSRIYTLDGGSISLLVPGGLVNVGLANPPANLAQLGLARDPSQLGIVTEKAGAVRIFSQDDVLVNQSRVFTLFGGDITIWSTKGNIDAGRGAKSAISAPPPTVLVDPSGNVTIDFSAAVAGSGIRTILTGDGIKPGNVSLMAPAGFVNAGDAGIGSAGNLNIAAQSVIGLDNIQVGGTSTGVPPEASGLGASLSGVSGAASSSTNAAGAAVMNRDAAKDSAAPLAQSALGWLDVFVEGFGEEVCKPSDAECLKRNRSQ